MPQRDARIIGGLYQTGQVITSGGMLTTCTAYNRNTNDVAGLYIIELPSAEQITMAQQFMQPLEKRRAVQSPHVVRVHNWGIDGNRAYIATDPPRGVTLQHVLDNENIDLPRAVDLTQQIALGLKALHEQNIVGADLRPQLITVDTIDVTDRVQIDDVGLRTLLLSLGYASSQRGDDIGYLDPRYAPPEYITSGYIGPWSDLYQLGLLLFMFVTGRLPFVGRTPAETGILQSTAPVPVMAQFKHDTPEALQVLIEGLLAKETTRRISSASSLLNALSALSLPPRTGSIEQITGGIQRKDGIIGTPSLTLTTEMPRVNDDIALQPTDARPAGSPPPSTAISLPEVPNADGVYGYLCYELPDNDKKKNVQRFAIIQKNTVVGRLDPKRGVSPDLDLSSLDPTMTISRLHARIRFEETFFYIEDLKSRNKTRLGELILTPLKAELLQHGDTIQFGSVRLKFEIPGMEKHTGPQSGSPPRA